MSHSVSQGLFICLCLGAELLELLLCQGVERTAFHAGQELKSLIYGGDWIDVESFLCHSVDNLLRKQNVVYVELGNNDTLFSCKAKPLAHGVEPDDFLAYTTYWLNIAMLVHRTGGCNILPEAYTCHCRKEGIELSRGCRVSLYHSIGLLETDAGPE